MRQQQQQQHSDRPAYHLAPRQGWLNDPNGPLYHNGKYHMFYQHLVQACEWGFGIVWGHAVSTDLVHWEHLPEALVPTPGGVDADGCFSGCATVDNEGRPIILFTGVRLRSNKDCPPLPPPDRDLQLPFIESQCYAIADPGCDRLSVWHKSEMPFISLPPREVAAQLAGWRDPYIIHRGDGVTQPWVMLLGSGIKGRGGTALMYSSWDLLSGWQYVGMLACGEGDTGLVWECPLLALLPSLPLHPPAAPAAAQPQAHAAAPQHAPVHSTAADPHALCAAGCHCHQHPLLVSSSAPHNGIAPHKPHALHDPHAVHQPSASHDPALRLAQAINGSQQLLGASEDGQPVAATDSGGGGAEAEGEEEDTVPPHSWFFCISPDAPTNPTLYWLGDYDGREFHVGAAKGPLKLDLGDILYAPNTLEDPHGRLLLWGWLQERRKVGSYDYAGCLSVPRMLHRHNGRLHQSPVPEIANLRTDVSWVAEDVQVLESSPVPLQHVTGCHLDIEVTLRRGDAAASGLLLRCFDTSVGEGDAYLLYHWERRHVEVVVEGLHPDTLEYSTEAPTARRMGGAVESAAGAVGAEGEGEEVALRVLLDHSVLEVFLGSGEVLSTRVYLGAPPADSQLAAVEFVSQGGATTLARVAAYEVDSIWRVPPAPQPQVPEAAVADAEVPALPAQAPAPVPVPVPVAALEAEASQQEEISFEPVPEAQAPVPALRLQQAALQPAAPQLAPAVGSEEEELHGWWGEGPLLREPTLAIESNLGTGLGNPELLQSWLAVQSEPARLLSLRT